jgi:hypothetical protein
VTAASRLTPEQAERLCTDAIDAITMYSTGEATAAELADLDPTLLEGLALYAQLLETTVENDEGRIAVYRNASGGLVGRALGKDEEPKPYERLYITHFATCVPYLEQQARAKAEREAARAGR